MKKAYIYNDWVYEYFTNEIIDGYTTPVSGSRYRTRGINSFDIISYDLPIEMAQGATGKVVLAGSVEEDMSYHIMRIDDRLYHIKQSESVSGGNTTLTVGDDLSILDDAMYLAVPSNPLGVTFVECFPRDRNFLSRIYCPYLYGRPHSYFSEITQEQYAELLPISIDYELIRFDGLEDATIQGVKRIPINVGKLLRLMRGMGYNLQIHVDKDNLILQHNGKIEYQKEVPIFDNDGHSKVLSADFNNNVCSYVGVLFNYTGAPDEIFMQFFINHDGIALNIKDVEDFYPNRYGYTSIIQNMSIKTEAQAKALAQEEIDKSTYEHKIVFESDKELHIGQPVCICLKRGNYHSFISSVVRKSSSDRWQYSCGALPVTASDLIKDNAWAYNQIPKNPKKGQLVFV